MTNEELQKLNSLYPYKLKDVPVDQYSYYLSNFENVSKDRLDSIFGRLHDKSPEIYEFSDEQLESMRKFLEQDVRPRLVKARKNEKLPYDDVEEYTDLTNPQLMIFGTTHLNRMSSKFGGSGTLMGAYFPEEDFVYLDSNQEHQPIADVTLMHELDHRYRLKSNLSPYTKKELDLLNRAYNYEYFKDSENPTLKGVYHNGPIEKSSVNRELRYRIYDATGLVGKELDEYIDIIPDDLLLKFYYTLPYTSSLKDEQEEMENGTLDTKAKSKAVRDALKYVGYNDTQQSPFNFQYMT